MLTDASPKPKLPQRERAICGRLREVRLKLKIGQPDFAKELGIPFSRLASYEYARAPVKFELGFSLCKQFNLSLRWLAKGVLPMRPFTPIVSILLDKFNVRTLFSAIYDKHLSEIVESRLEELDVDSLTEKTWIKDFVQLGVSRAESHLLNVIGLIQSVSRELNEEDKMQFGFALERLAFSYDPRIKQMAQKLSLTSSSLKRNTDGAVKSEIENLIELVKQKASTRGAKAALAKELEVAPARISEWLSGIKEPGGNYALRLRKWVKGEA